MTVGTDTAMAACIMTCANMGEPPCWSLGNDNDADDDQFMCHACKVIERTVNASLKLYEATKAEAEGFGVPNAVLNALTEFAEDMGPLCGDRFPG